MAQASQAQIPGLPDICPIKPSACIPDIPIDVGNPLGSFIEIFFGSSIEDTLKAVGRMVLAVPEPDFTGAWFHSVYAEMGITWIGWMVALAVFLGRMAWFGWRDIRFAGQITKDFMIDLFGVAALPILLSGLQLISSSFSTLFIDMFKVDNPDFLFDLVPQGYLSVGWMSLLLRGASLFLMLELLFVFLIMIVTTVFMGMFFPLRSLGAFGDNFQARAARYLLLGIYAKPVMLFVIGVSVLIIPYISKVGVASAPFTMFGLAAFTIMGCALGPILIFRGTKKAIKTQVVRANASFESRSRTGSIPAESREERSRRHEQAQDARRHGRHQKLAGAAAAVGVLLATGGTGVGAAASIVSTKAAVVKRGVDSFRAFKSRSQS